MCRTKYQLTTIKEIMITNKLSFHTMYYKTICISKTRSFGEGIHIPNWVLQYNEHLSISHDIITYCMKQFHFVKVIKERHVL